MQNLSLLLLFFLSIHLVADELKWVDEQIQAIKPPRNAISQAKINATEDPFIFLNKKVSTKTTTRKTAKSTRKKNTLHKASKKETSQTTGTFSLDAIINTSALINGQWYKLNSKIGKYTLSSIHASNVILSYKKKKLTLSTRSKTRKLKFRNN